MRNIPCALYASCVFFHPSPENGASRKLPKIATGPRAQGNLPSAATKNQKQKERKAMKTTRKEAIAKIEGSITADKKNVVYFDDSERKYYLSPIEDIADLQELMDSADEDVARDAYSHWCAGNSHDECTPDGDPITEITIGDVGCCDSATWDGQNVREKGSPHVAKILQHVDFSEDDITALARTILAAWSVGYDGDMAEARVVVKVTRGEESAEVRA